MLFNPVLIFFLADEEFVQILYICVTGCHPSHLSHIIYVTKQNIFSGNYSVPRCRIKILQPLNVWIQKSDYDHSNPRTTTKVTLANTGTKTQLTLRTKIQRIVGIKNQPVWTSQQDFGKIQISGRSYRDL